MRSIKLYYVYDNVNEVAITPIIPQANDLVAALGFRDAYIKNKDSKMTIPYSALDLVRFADVSTTEDGEFFINTDNKICNEVKRIPGKDIMDFIKNQMMELGIDDNIVEEIE